MFDAAQHISTWISLVAFVVAAAVYAYRLRLNSAIELVKQASKQERGDVVLAIAERFSVDTAGLTQKQRADIVIKQLEIRARRDMMILAAFAIVAILAAFVTIVALLRPTPSDISGGQASIKYTLCIGWHGDCPQGAIKLDCGEDEAKYAANKCKKFKTEILNEFLEPECPTSRVVEISCSAAIY